MRGAVLYGPRDVRFEERESPKVVEPTDAVIRIALMCVCGSDLWPYRGLQPINGPTPMGHEYCGIVEEVGGAVRSVKPGQFARGGAERPRAVLRPRPPPRRPRAGATLLAEADRPGAGPEDRPGKGLRPDAASRPGGRGLPRDGRAPRDQDAAAAVRRIAPAGMTSMKDQA